MTETEATRYEPESKGHSERGSMTRSSRENVAGQAATAPFTTGAGAQRVNRPESHGTVVRFLITPADERVLRQERGALNVGQEVSDAVERLGLAEVLRRIRGSDS